MVMPRVFGTLADGRQVHAIQLQSDAGLRAEILTYGGILRTLEVPCQGGHRNVILSLPDLAAYEADPHHLGTIVGRYGNRIGGARFQLDGVEYQLDRNEGDNQLHGGTQGFGQSLWEIAEVGEDFLTLLKRSPDGEQGYPGNLEVRAEYRLRGLTLELQFHASTDATTPLNLTHHPYFNLSGNPRLPITSHRLQIPADRYLPVGEGMLPTGEVRAVQGTAFDLRQWTTAELARQPDEPQLQAARGYDHCLVLAAEAEFGAQLQSPDGQVSMQLHSSMPALQFYEGQSLPPEYGHALCLEPQFYPDAPNQPHFPSTLLHPGEVRRQKIEYRFSA